MVSRKTGKHWIIGINGEMGAKGSGSCTSQNSSGFWYRAASLPEYACRSLVGGERKRLQVPEHTPAPSKVCRPHWILGSRTTSPGRLRAAALARQASLGEPAGALEPSPPVVWPAGAGRRRMGKPIGRVVFHSRPEPIPVKAPPRTPEPRPPGAPPGAPPAPQDPRGRAAHPAGGCGGGGRGAGRGTQDDEVSVPAAGR